MLHARHETEKLVTILSSVSCSCCSFPCGHSSLPTVPIPILLKRRVCFSSVTAARNLMQSSPNIIHDYWIFYPLLFFHSKDAQMFGKYGSPSSKTSWVRQIQSHPPTACQESVWPTDGQMTGPIDTMICECSGRTSTAMKQVTICHLWSLLLLFLRTFVIVERAPIR